jgi:glyoxylase-like metal-dependent hydrolase (beta-lactamase superfamily II)
VAPALSDGEIARLVAPNPGPMTLDGTNTYLVGRDPTVVIDPGPADAGHVDSVRAAAEGRGGIGAVLLTHSHPDHADGVRRLGVEPRRPADGEAVEGLRALATPGHAEDHLCFLLEHEGEEGPELVCFTGDLVLGEGYSFVPPRTHGGSLADYLESLRRLAGLSPARLEPGHGPPVRDPAAAIADYVEHRLERERRLLAALERGQRSRELLLAEVWDDVPEELRGAAAVVMQAHLEKLEGEDRLPADIKD